MNEAYLLKVEEIDFSSTNNWMYLCIVFLMIYVIKALLFGRILQKAGVKSWKAWVPFVNIWNWFKIGGYKGSWTLVLILSCVISSVAYSVNMVELQTALLIISAISFIVFFVMALASGISIQRKLNKPLPFIILLFINLIAPLWMWILALDYSEWNDKKGRKLVKKSKK